MKTAMILAILVLGIAGAQSYKPATVRSADKNVVNDKTPSAAINYRTVNENFTYAIRLSGPPNATTYITQCKKAVMEILKTPSVAKFIPQKTDYVLYLIKAGVYYGAGQVDSQNSYGAMLRGDWSCWGVYSGNAKTGVLILWPRLTSD